MKMPYDFEACPPPGLTEASLRAEAERRRLRRQTALLTLAAVLLQTAALLLGVRALLEGLFFPGIVCVGYAVVSAAGGGVMALVMSGREESFS